MPVSTLVTDTTGSAVPNASVTVTRVDTGIATKTTTNISGNYVVTPLQSGTYSVTVEAQGFKKSVSAGITLNLQDRLAVNVSLEVGQITETVEVHESTPPLQTDTSYLGQVVDSQKIVDLPLNGRNFMQLTRLTAAVNTGDGYSITSGSVGTVVKDQTAGSIYGQRNSNNQFRLDGIQTVEMTGNRARLTPNMDAIEEFTLIKGIFPAEFGGVAGGTVNVAVKSGTNTLHGTLFEFLRNDKLDTRNFFDTTGRAPNLRRNQFGGVLGGPIKKDRTFYFVSFDALRLRQASTSTNRIPTPAMLGGDLSSLGKTINDPLNGNTPFAGALIPSARIHPLAKALGALYPAPNNPGDPNRNWIAAFSEAVSNDDWIGRADLKRAISFGGFSSGLATGQQTDRETEPSEDASAFHEL
jgi:hypothetical protein